MRIKLLGLILPFTLMVSLMVLPVKAGEGEWDVALGFKGKFTDIDLSGSEREGDRSITGGASTSEELTKTTHSKSIEIPAIFVEFVGRSGYGGITAGFDWVPGSSTIGNKSRTETDIDAGTTGTSYTYIAKADVENIVTFYLEPTLYVSDGIGLYVKGGATGMDLKTLEDISSGEVSSAYPDKVMVGGILGGGIRYTAPFGLLVKIEYTETNFKPIEMLSATGNRNLIKARLDTTATTLALGWQF